MGKKMKSLESQLEKQQRNLKEGQSRKRLSRTQEAGSWAKLGVCARGICGWSQPADDKHFPTSVFMLTSLTPALPTLVSPDHSSLLLHVKQFVSDLRGLSCQMAILHGNGKGGFPSLLPPFLPLPLQPALQTPHVPSAPLASEKSCCPVNWVEYEGSCYWFSRSGKPWPEADNYCKLEDAHLVVVGSMEEQVRALPGLTWELGDLRRGDRPPLSSCPPEICPAPCRSCQHLDRPH